MPKASTSENIAGTGSFLRGDGPGLSSRCTVFAESEVIILIAKGEPRENIIAGIHASIGSRMIAMARRVASLSR